MRELAPGVRQLKGFPPNAINTYLVEDVLIDAGAKFDTRRILKELSGTTLTAHALTHAHSDHQGASHAVCTKFGVPFWVGAEDVAAAEDTRLIKERQPKHPMTRIGWRLFTGPPHPVDRALREGDEVAGFRVLHTPGHSLGHVSFWRESDRVLILGDVLCNMDTLTGRPALQLPKNFYTPDPERNRVSAKRLGELEPSLVCFGHGKPLRDTRKFVEFCSGL